MQQKVPEAKEFLHSWSVKRTHLEYIFKVLQLIYVSCRSDEQPNSEQQKKTELWLHDSSLKLISGLKSGTKRITFINVPKKNRKIYIDIVKGWIL